MTMRAMLMLKVKEKILDPKLMKTSDCLDSKGFFIAARCHRIRDKRIICRRGTECRKSKQIT